VPHVTKNTSFTFEKEGSMSKNNLKVAMTQLIAHCIISILLFGCATMLAPGKDEVTLKTIPEGAEVYDGANLLGKTPLTYSFDRETFGQKVLTIKMEGHKSHDLQFKRSLEEKSLFNLVFILTTLGATSWGIDAVSGNMIKYSPNSYLIELSRDGDSANQIDKTRWQRVRFVVLNHAYLRKYISKGDGEYLRAYYEIRRSKHAFNKYQEFLSHVSNQAQYLLTLSDPIEFFNELEKSFDSIQTERVSTFGIKTITPADYINYPDQNAKVEP
jgi:hypothetical protein